MNTNFTLELRVKPRERLVLPIKIIPFKNGKIICKEYTGKTIDVSESGIGFQVPLPIPIDNDIICIVNLGENEDPECLIGKVVWSMRNENGYRYGLQLKQKKSNSYNDFFKKIQIRSNNSKKPVQKKSQLTSDEAILKIARYLNTSSIKLDQIQMLDSKIVHKVNPEQVWISDTFNVDEYAWEIEELRPYSVFCSYAYPNLNCPICFDHKLDHYPMMSLFEMTRQMGLAIMHQFYHVPMNGYISIVQKMSFDYRVFAELDFPLSVFLVDTCEPAFVNKVQNRVVELFFVQENVICAYVLGEMSAIKTEIYTRIRKSSRKAKLESKYGNVEEVKFVTNNDVVSLFTPRNK